MKKFFYNIWLFFIGLFSADSKVSSMRFFRFMIILNVTIEWQHAIWATALAHWTPSIESVSFAATVFGFTFIQTVKEIASKTNTTKEDQNDVQ